MSHFIKNTLTLMAVALGAVACQSTPSVGQINEPPFVSATPSPSLSATPTSPSFRVSLSNLSASVDVGKPLIFEVDVSPEPPQGAVLEVFLDHKSIGQATRSVARKYSFFSETGSFAPGKHVLEVSLKQGRKVLQKSGPVTLTLLASPAPSAQSTLAPTPPPVEQCQPNVQIQGVSVETQAVLEPEKNTKISNSLVLKSTLSCEDIKTVQYVYRFEEGELQTIGEPVSTPDYFLELNTRALNLKDGNYAFLTRVTLKDNTQVFSDPLNLVLANNTDSSSSSGGGGGGGGGGGSGGGSAPPPVNPPAPTPTPDPAIVFTTNRDGNFEVYRSAPSGMSPVRLTQTPEDEFSPHRSKDGSKIVFVSRRDGNLEIYSMDNQGQNPTRLTDNSANESYPVWSPDGSKIAFSSDRDGNSEIYVMNADGSNVQRLTHNPGTDAHPSWSPDGSKLVFASERNSRFNIYIMNANGSNVQTVTNSNSAINWNPSWSPLGDKIAFEANRDSPKPDIYTVNLDGSGLLRLTTDPASDLAPAWSFDGKEIVFSSLRDGDHELYRINADGSSLNAITDNAVDDKEPDWS